MRRRARSAAAGSFARGSLVRARGDAVRGSSRFLGERFVFERGGAGGVGGFPLREEVGDGALLRHVVRARRER